MADRPISVGELLRREGHQSEAHDSQARRALGGVAVGAVLAFGAVVGGLVLHNAAATPDSLPSAGGGAASGAGFNGAVPAAATGTIGSAPNVRPAAQVNSTATKTSPVRIKLPSAPSAPAVHVPSTSTVTPTSDAPASTPQTTAQTPTGTSTSTGSSTATNPNTGSSTGTATSPQSPSSPSTGTSSSGSGGSGGGLLGTVTGTLGDITSPVFNWFGGN